MGQGPLGRRAERHTGAALLGLDPVRHMRSRRPARLRRRAVDAAVMRAECPNCHHVFIAGAAMHWRDGSRTVAVCRTEDAVFTDRPDQVTCSNCRRSATYLDALQRYVADLQ